MHHTVTYIQANEHYLSMFTSSTSHIYHIYTPLAHNLTKTSCILIPLLHISIRDALAIYSIQSRDKTWPFFYFNDHSVVCQFVPPLLTCYLASQHTQLILRNYNFRAKTIIQAIA